MEYQIVSNIAKKQTLFIDDDTTVGEVRAIIGIMLDVSDDLCLSMSYNGKQVTQDELTWGEVVSIMNFRTQGTLDDHGRGGGCPSQKIFCHVGARQQQQEGVSHEALRAAVSSNERLQREQARLMEPMVDTMTQNPAFMESILNMNPALKKMTEEHPELAKQIRDPETIKMMMMSQYDPDRRREISRQLELQLAQISTIPGGQQVLDRYLTGFLRDAETLGVRSEADLHTVSEDVARPDPSKESNCEALPNPWKQTPQPNVGAYPAQMPYLPRNPFGMGGMEMGSHNPTPEIMNNLLTTLAQCPNLAQGPMNKFTANQNTTDSHSSNPYLRPPDVAAMTNTQVSTNFGESSAASSSFLGNKRMVYEPQLRILKEMGFDDEELCLRALEATNGDVEEALAYIDEHQTH